jgi:putative phosphoesterase
MKVGILSDSHDALPCVAAAVALFKSEGVELILHAGDIIAPFTARLLAESGIPVRAVYGNNDGEKRGLARVLESICEPPLRLDISGIPVVMVHSEDQAGESDCKVVVSGHTHKASIRTQNGVTFVNPGECCGYLTGRRTVVIWDVPDMSFEVVEL